MFEEVLYFLHQPARGFDGVFDAVGATEFYGDPFLRHDATHAIVNDGAARHDGLAGGAGAGSGDDGGNGLHQAVHVVAVAEWSDGNFTFVSAKGPLGDFVQGVLVTAAQGDDLYRQVGCFQGIEEPGMVIGTCITGAE